MGRSHNGNARQLGRLREQCPRGKHEARRDRATAVSPGLVNHVDVCCRAKVHHNDGRAVGLDGGDCVGNAVCAHGLGVGHVDGHAIAVARGNHQGLAVKDGREGHLPGAGERWHHAGHARRGHLAKLKAVHSKEAKKTGAQGVRGVGGLRGHAPRVHGVSLAAKQTNGRVRVAHVDR